MMQPKGLSYTLKGNFGMILDAEGQRFESSFCKGADCQYFGLQGQKSLLRLLRCFRNVAVNSMSAHRPGCVPVELHLHKEARAGFGPRVTVCRHALLWVWCCPVQRDSPIRQKNAFTFGNFTYFCPHSRARNRYFVIFIFPEVKVFKR